VPSASPLSVRWSRRQATRRSHSRLAVAEKPRKSRHSFVRARKGSPGRLVRPSVDLGKRVTPALAVPVEDASGPLVARHRSAGPVGSFANSGDTPSAAANLTVIAWSPRSSPDWPNGGGRQTRRLVKAGFGRVTIWLRTAPGNAHQRVITGWTGTCTTSREQMRTPGTA
jgi:hypothetical protein